ncbi:MAG: hypothetical protein IJ737_02865 [Ruminococcus sp.]|nr:hypothetical protein [Ruminococcus sp.]
MQTSFEINNIFLLIFLLLLLLVLLALPVVLINRERALAAEGDGYTGGYIEDADLSDIFDEIVEETEDEPVDLVEAQEYDPPVKMTADPQTEDAPVKLMTDPPTEDAPRKLDENVRFPLIDDSDPAVSSHSVSQSQPQPEGSTFDRFAELNDLLTAGFITQEDYDRKKEELMKQL